MSRSIPKLVERTAARRGAGGRRSRGAARGAPRRRGSAYVLALGLGMTITVIGLAWLTLGRISVRTASDCEDWLGARTLAFSAAEHALIQIERTEDWRTTYAGVTVEKSLGNGTFRWQLVDEADGDLTDDPSDPVTILATGFLNRARYALRLETTIKGVPLEVLATCAASGKRTLNNQTVTLTGAPLSINKKLENLGTINGDVETIAVKKQGTIHGTLTTGITPKPMPDGSVFDTYQAMAVQIPYTGDIQGVVLSPGSNPWGPTNPDGLYYIDAGGADLHIKESRIHGTLVVKCAPKKVFLEDAVLLHNYRSDYPVLIVDGDVEMKHNSATLDLSESVCATNFNPPTAPYEGESDADQSDSYPNEVRGLVHVKDDALIAETARFRGTIICEGDLDFEGNSQIIYDSTIYQDPPVGYSEGAKPRPETWSRVVD